MNELQLKEFYEKFIETVGEKETVNFFQKASKLMENDPKGFKTKILFASKLL